MRRLEERIADLVAANGPLRIDSYMALALGDPTEGYYMSREPFGTAGDFVTAPDVSQLFGEIVGAWLVHAWREAGAPSPFSLVELGPGRATLLSDILRVGKLVPAFLDGAELHLVETSRRLRSGQADMLDRIGQNAVWHDDVESLPHQPTIMVANEFFDALPVRQFVMTAEGWRERVVGLVEGRLAFGLAPGVPDDAPTLEPGEVVERAPARSALAARLGGHIGSFGGVALILDYGYCGPASGDTFQAVRGHRFADPLEAPGSSDLTAHVDFARLAMAFRQAGAVTFGPVDQGDFLSGLGIAARAQQLMAGKSPGVRSGIAGDLQRLVAPDQMGRLFKVLAVAHKPLALPPFPPAAADKTTPCRKRLP